MPLEQAKPLFFCENCGHESPKWLGFCPGCGERTPLVEVLHRRSRSDYRWINTSISQPQELSTVSLHEEKRTPLPFSEMTRALGGGMVNGSLILVAGEPGVGKSTLLLQTCQALAEGDKKVIYVSGEESPSQIKLRCSRLGLSGKGIHLLSESDVDSVLVYLPKEELALVIIDSIQTLYTQEVSSHPGSVAQVRECTRRLMNWAKSQGVPVLLSGHVTKDGAVAGPRVLEHMVDVVLYLEGDNLHSHRVLRSVKNRFGSTNEVGLFYMSNRGMQEVTDPSQDLMSERQEQSVGSAITPIIEGSRPLLMEVQALNSASFLSTPRRIANGLELNRLLMLVAVLDSRSGIKLANQDIIVSVVGGLKLSEPAADLSIALAIVSSRYNMPIPKDLSAFGEIGLSGELRSVPQVGRRLEECARLGLSRCIVPSVFRDSLKELSGLHIEYASTVGEAITLGLGESKDVR